MIRDELKAKLLQLNKADFNLGFPHDDCRKIAEKLSSCEWMKADINTFFHSLWSLSAIDRVVKHNNEELKKDKIWLEKSFFQRFPKYSDAQKIISQEFTPTLYNALKINEELREVLLEIINEELLKRNK